MTQILLVEDNEMNRDMLSRRLRRKGYEVYTAVDGAAGLATSRSAQPDLILLDMRLPEIDGWEVTRRLKADEATRSIPIIALTAHAMERRSRKGHRGGLRRLRHQAGGIHRLAREDRGLASVNQPCRLIRLLKCGCSYDDFRAMVKPELLSLRQRHGVTLRAVRRRLYGCSALGDANQAA